MYLTIVMHKYGRIYTQTPTSMPSIGSNLKEYMADRFKVAEDDITFKLAIFFLNHCLWTTIQASVVSFKRQN